MISVAANSVTDWVGLALMGGPLMDPVTIIIALLLVTGWVFICNWMALDVPYVGADKNLWWGLAMGVGTLGLLMLWLFPTSLALTSFAVLVIGQTAAYTVVRNLLVPKHLRVLTPEWFAGLLKHKDTRVGAELTLKQSSGPVNLKWMDGPSQTFDRPEDPDFQLGFDTGSTILFEAINRRANEIRFTPAGDNANYTVSLLIDGFGTPLPPLPKQHAAYTILWIKKVCGLDLNEYRKPQKGKTGVMAVKRKVELQVATQGALAGEEMTIRIMDKSSMRRMIDLGMPPDLLESFKKIVGTERGLFIVGGQHGSGITTSMYAFLREHDLFQRNVATIEDPVDIELENVTQVEFKSDGGKKTFAKEVLTFYRAKDPDVLMIGRSDPETLQAAAAYAERRKCYIGLECTSAVEGLSKVIKAIGDGDTVNKTLIGVSCQKLVRVLCTECRVPYKPSPDALKRLNVSPERVSELFKPPTAEEIAANQKGVVCPKCQGTGYFGQTGVFEVLIVSDPIRQLISNGSSLKEIQNQARKEKMVYLHEQILRKVIDGTTSVAELMRVMQSGPTAKS